MDNLTKKLAEALEQSKKRIQEYDRFISLLYGEEKMSGKTLSIIEEALAEYREQEKNPKNELVELDEEKILNHAEKVCNEVLKISPTANKNTIALAVGKSIYQTFGTKRVSVEEILDVLEKTNLSHNCGCCASEPNENDAKAIHQIIYGKAVEDEAK